MIVQPFEDLPWYTVESTSHLGARKREEPFSRTDEDGVTS